MADVDYAREEDLGFIRIDGPLVEKVRAGLLHALREGLADDGAAALVLFGAGQGFAAGAADAPDAEPRLPQVIDAFEDSPKPVIAALHGEVLGGGLELALGCHFRVGLAGSRFGLPAVRQGLIPSAGATQRLPRLIGLEHALELMTGGEPIAATEAAHLGLLDDVSEETEPRPAGAALAREVLAEGLLPRRTRDITATLDVGSAFFDAFRLQTRGRVGEAEAPMRVIDAVEDGLKLPFAEALRHERRIYLALRDGGAPEAARR